MTRTSSATRARRLTQVALIGFLVGLTLAAAGACAGTAAPAALVSGQAACGSCRMTIGSTRTAAQLAAPREEPVFFDDLWCLRDYLRVHRTLPSGTIAFVADHRTGAWVRGRDAIFVLADAVETPMGSHALAFADTASRASDPAAAAAPLLDPDDVFGVALPNGEP